KGACRSRSVNRQPPIPLATLEPDATLQQFLHTSSTLSRDARPDCAFVTVSGTSSLCPDCARLRRIRANSGSLGRTMDGSTSPGARSICAHLGDSLDRAENPGVGSSTLPLSTICFIG